MISTVFVSSVFCFRVMSLYKNCALCPTLTWDPNKKSARAKNCVGQRSLSMRRTLCSVLQCRTDTSLQVSGTRIELTTIGVNRNFRVLTHWGRVTQICVFNTRLFSLHNTLNYAIHRACLRMVLLMDVYRNLTSLWINLQAPRFLYIGTSVSLLSRERFLYI